MQSNDMSVEPVPPRRELHPRRILPDQPVVTARQDPLMTRLKPNPAWWWGVGAVWFATILASWIAGIGDIRNRSTVPVPGSRNTVAVSRIVPTAAPAQPVEHHDRGLPAPAGSPARTRALTEAAAVSASPVQEAAPVLPPPGASQDPAPARSDAVWVINLASLPDRTAADRFVAKVRSRDIPVQLQLVTVRGKKYWRVQTMGFATPEKARSNAANIKDKLALKDVWISKR